MNATGTKRPIRCLRCSRVLRAQSSQRLGYGRGCRAIIRAAAIAEAPSAGARPPAITAWPPA